MIDQIVQKQLREQYNPEGSFLRKIQKSLLDILVELDRICKENDIPYWLDSGTLLGAERHGGFIPWDDDVDVCILRKDWKRLRNALKKNLREPYKVHEVDSTSDYTHCWPRIVNEKITIHRMVKVGKEGDMEEKAENLGLDIFLQVNGSPRVARFVDLFYGRCFRRKYRIINDGRMNHFLGVVLFPIAKMIVGAARACGKWFHPETFIHDYGTGFYSVRKKKDIFPLSLIEFEGYMLSSPVDIPSYLQRIYNTYSQLPPEEKRETHNILSVDYEKR